MCLISLVNVLHFEFQIFNSNHAIVTFLIFIYEDPSEVCIELSKASVVLFGFSLKNCTGNIYVAYLW